MAARMNPQLPRAVPPATARTDVPPRPVGVVAALLAAVIAIGWLVRYQAQATSYASEYVRALAPANLEFKAQTLTLQRAALRQRDVLPIYGTSELYCCGAPFNAAQMFFNAPTGFAVFNVGYPVTEDLFFAEDFGALGADLRGKKVVVSDSPWFTAPGGITAQAYAHTFSPEIALVYAFDAPVPWGLRTAVARRMLAFPATVSAMPILRTGLWDAARGGWRGDLAYALLDPIGRVDAWIAQLQDARRTIQEIDTLAHPQPKGPTLKTLERAAAVRQSSPGSGLLSGLVSRLESRTAPQTPLWQLLAQTANARTPAPLNPHVPDKPQAIPWNADLTKGTALARQQSQQTYPFGITDDRWTKKCTDVQPAGACPYALKLYRAGWDNHAGAVFSEPAAFVQGEIASTSWTDLDLEFETLRAVQADPLAWVQPLQGLYSDYTPYSAATRRVVYDRYLAIARADGVTATTFQTHDDDPLFVDSFGHMSPRGWVFADRLLDLFWHGRLAQVQAELNAGGSTDRLFPASLNCPKPVYCRGVDDVPPPPGELADLPTGIPTVPLPKAPLPGPTPGASSGAASPAPPTATARPAASVAAASAAPRGSAPPASSGASPPQARAK